MSSRSGLRGRRTRVYDCNYNIGESYYKPTLDRMDRKLSGRPEVDEEPRLARPEPSAREPTTRSIPAFDDAIFDVHGARTSRGRPLSSTLEEDGFDDEIASSLRRIRANKKSSAFSEDVDNALSSFDSRSRLGLSEKLLDSVGIGQSDISNARRTLAENEERTERRISRRVKQNEEEAGNLTRWTAVRDDDTSAASQRAKASRARLSDLEDEMNEMNERHAVREQRAARLRALVAENDIENSMTSSTVLNSSSRTEKKQVSF